MLVIGIPRDTVERICEAWQRNDAAIDGVNRRK